MPSDLDAGVVAIGPSVDLLSGFAFPSHGFHETEGLPLIRIRDLGKDSTEVHFRGCYDDQFLVRNGDVLVGMDGDFVAVRWSGGPALLNQRVCKVSARVGGTLDGGYLFHVLQPHIDEIHRRTPQTTVRHLSAKSILDIRPFLPPLPQQRRIAEILDTLDEAIHKTERVIAKLQQIKQGLLHDLLTCGIDENGALRDPERHPEQFKDSPLGRIPREWGVSFVDHEFDITSGITLGPHRRPNRHPHPYLRVANVYRDRLALDDVAKLEARTTELVDKTLRTGDLLVVEGHANPEEIGRCAIVIDAVCGFTFQNHLFRLRARRIHPEYGLRWMNGEVVRSYWRRMCSTSSGLNTINRTLLRAVQIAVPVREEQERICTLLQEATSRLDSEQSEIAKLRTLKHGLMDDLLTGRVRVTVPEETAA